MYSDAKEFVKYWQEQYPDKALRGDYDQYNSGKHVGKIELLEEMMEMIEAMENRQHEPD